MLSEFYGPDILQDVGYGDRTRGKRLRKRKRRQEDKSIDQSTNNDTSKQEETEWQQLKQFLDPNPQLRGTAQDDEHPKVTHLKLYNFITLHCLYLSHWRMSIYIWTIPSSSLEWHDVV